MKSIQLGVAPSSPSSLKRQISILTFSIRYVLEYLLSQVWKNGRKGPNHYIQNFSQGGLTGASLGVTCAFTVKPERQQLLSS